MASAGSAPTTSNGIGAAQSQMSSALNMANIATQANRINQNNNNGSVSYTSTSKFDQSGYETAMNDWKATPADKRGAMPTHGEFTSQQWTQNDVLNPTLQRSATNQQQAQLQTSLAAAGAAAKARATLSSDFNQPKLTNYLSSVPALDKTKVNQVNAYDSKFVLGTQLGPGVKGVDTSTNAKAGTFNSTGTNLNTTASFGAGAGVKSSTATNGDFKTTAKVDGSVNDNLGGVKAVDQTGVANQGKFSYSGPGVDTSVSDNVKNLGKAESGPANQGKFSYSGPGVDTSINDNLGGVKAVDQNGVSNMGDFKNTTPNAANFNAQGINGVNQTLNSNAAIDTNLNALLTKNGVNTKQQTFDGGPVVPQFDETTADRYGKAAYEAQMAFMRDDLAATRTQEANRLALQGLGVDSEASSAAMSGVYNSQAKQLNQLANQSILTGADIGRQNYSAQLAGNQQSYDQRFNTFNTNQAAGQKAFDNTLNQFTTGNTAQNQKYAMDVSKFDENNAAQAQKFSQAMQAQTFNNSANATNFDRTNQTYQNNLNAKNLNNNLVQTRNAAQSQAFDQASSKFQLNNAASNQAFARAQDVNTQNNQIAALNAQLTAGRNDAQQQNYDQATKNFQLNNAASEQAFGRAQDTNTQNNSIAALNAQLVAARNASQGQAFDQATQKFQLNNAAQKQTLDQQLAQYQAGITKNAANSDLYAAQNAAQQQIFNQKVAQLGFQNDAKNQQFAQNQTKFNTNVDALKTNAALKTADNANQQQLFDQKLAQLGFQNNAFVQQNNINQQDFQNQLAAQAANLNLRNANNDTRTQALNEQYKLFGADMTTAEANRYRSLNEMNALLGGTQVSGTGTYTPFAQQATTQGADYMSATQMDNQNAMAKYNQQAAAANSTNQSIASLAGTAAMIAMMSDKRLKTNVKSIGKTTSGRDLKSWVWNEKANKLGLTGRSQGVIAQENKDIAVQDPMTGFLAVDYSKLNTKKKKVA